MGRVLSCVFVLAFLGLIRRVLHRDLVVSSWRVQFLGMGVSANIWGPYNTKDPSI